MLTGGVVFLFQMIHAMSNNYFRTQHSPTGLKYAEFTVREEASLYILYEV